jgi:hypothetical protein
LSVYFNSYIKKGQWSAKPRQCQVTGVKNSITGADTARFDPDDLAAV